MHIVAPLTRRLALVSARAEPTKSPAEMKSGPMLFTLQLCTYYRVTECARAHYVSCDSSFWIFSHAEHSTIVFEGTLELCFEGRGSPLSFSFSFETLLNVKAVSFTPSIPTLSFLSAANTCSSRNSDLDARSYQMLEFEAQEARPVQKSTAPSSADRFVLLGRLSMANCDILSLANLPDLGLSLYFPIRREFLKWSKKLGSDEAEAGALEVDHVCTPQNFVLH